MKLQLIRTERGDRYTMGRLVINGEPFCDTLEPTDRHLEAATMRLDQKVFGQTAIPNGTYPVVLTYSPRFKCTLPLLKDVPHFEGIRIHSGNSVTDTAGCILVGRQSTPGRLTDSRQTLRQLMKVLNNHPRDQDIAIAIN